METSLPYLVAPGSVKTALEKVKQAATPERFTGDFVTTKLNIKGGTGRALIPFFKKVGLVGSDGVPTELYKRFRNTSTSQAAVAEAIKIGYRRLSELNEYFYDLKDKELLGLINQATGAEADSPVSKFTLSTFRNLRSFADFDQTVVEGGTTQIMLPEEQSANHQEAPTSRSSFTPPPTTGGIGMNLAYTINLNLPASSDQAVFNAIFKSIKEHLLDQD